MMRALDALFAARSFEGRAVFLFGHCNAAEEAADCLLARGVLPVAVLDNNASKRGLTCRGIPIAPPERIRDCGAADGIVLIAARFHAEMEAQLRRIGYDGEIVRLVAYDSFAEYSLSDETRARRVARMRRGAKTLERIRDRHPAQHLVVCPNNALGDVYQAMAFLPAYLAKRGIGDVAIVTVGEACRRVAELFGAEDVATLAQEEMDEFVQALIFTRERNAIIAHHDRPYTDNIIKWLDRHFLSFMDYYRRAVYGLAADTPPASPSRLASFENGGQMPKGRSVILSPRAKSVTEPEDAFWEGIAEDCANRGLGVYTNTAGGEPSIRGTTPLCVSIAQVIAAAEHAGTFIGLRSGLCDVLRTAKCRKIVVFPDCFYSTTPHKVADFFALPGWETIVWRAE